MYAPTTAHVTHTHRRRNAISPIEACAMALIIATLIGATLLGSARSDTKVSTVPVTVHAGDSLWSIASEHPAEGLTTAQTVELLKRVNDLDSVALRPGAVIHAPGEPAGEALAMR